MVNHCPFGHLRDDYSMDEAPFSLNIESIIGVSVTIIGGKMVVLGGVGASN